MTAPTSSPRRLAIVLSHPTQYYSPWFQWLGAHEKFDFKVFYLWDFGVIPRQDPEFARSVKWDVDLLSGYESEFVPNASGNPGTDRFFGLNNPTLGSTLGRWSPDCILIFGYNWASHIRVFLWARTRGIPLIFRGDSHLIGRRSVPVVKRLLLRLLFSQVSAFTYVGEANRAYFEAFGVPERKLFFAPHSVNGALFCQNLPGLGDQVSALRSALGLGAETRVMLFAGKLVSGKQPFELLDAFMRLDPENTALVFVGDGPELERLRLAADAKTDRGAKPLVRFLPFANQSEMPARYRLADIFVLPSQGDSWGLAVNEAMQMGVPCIVSDRVGCQRDLVTDGKTGWVYEHGEPEALLSVLARAVADMRSTQASAAIRQGVSERIRGYSYVETTAGLLKAIGSLAG